MALSNEATMYKHILIPIDGSELSNKAADHGVALAKAIDAKVTVITVSMPYYVVAIEPGLFPEKIEDYQRRVATLATKYLDVAKDIAAAAHVSCDTLQVEHAQPYQAIIETAKEKGCDLIVMASHSRRGVAAIVLGSETVKVLTHSTVPVLVVRAPRSPALLMAS
jgi:nucleotide-binding universal stress UspA family protein